MNFSARQHSSAVLVMMLAAAGCGDVHSEGEVNSVLQLYAPGMQMGMRADSALPQLKSAESWYIDGPGYRDSLWRGPRGYADLILRFEEDDDARSRRPHPTHQSDTPQPPPSADARLIEVRLVARDADGVFRTTERHLENMFGEPVEGCVVIGDAHDRVLQWAAGSRIVVLRLRNRGARSPTNYGQNGDLRFYATAGAADEYLRPLRQGRCTVE